MSYLLDKQNKRKKFIRYGIVVFIFIFVFYFKIPVLDFFSSSMHVVFRPVLFLKNGTIEILSDIGGSFSFKKNLIKENESLRSQLNENNLQMQNYNNVLDENIKLKEILDRKNEKISLILGAILAKPGVNPYDTLLIDIGEDHNLKIGDLVFARGNVPIGRVHDVYMNTSNVVLFSSSGEKTEVVSSGTSLGKGGEAFMQIIGRGGGNFEMILPRDLNIPKGTTFSLPGINSDVVAVVNSTLSDPRDSFAKALLSSPVNVQELKFVQVKK